MVTECCPIVHKPNDTFATGRTHRLTSTFHSNDNTLYFVNQPSPPASNLKRHISNAQDTPSVKSTYSAAVRAPAQLTSLMSAVLEAGVGAGGLTHLPAPAAGAVASKVQRFRQVRA